MRISLPRDWVNKPSRVATLRRLKRQGSNGARLVYSSARWREQKRFSAPREALEILERHMRERKDDPKFLETVEILKKVLLKAIEVQTPMYMAF